MFRCKASHNFRISVPTLPFRSFPKRLPFHICFRVTSISKVHNFLEIPQKKFSVHLNSNTTKPLNYEIVQMADITTITPKNRKEWRAWLEENHDKEEKIWIVYHKKSSGKETISYSDVVEECLCFGWIDSKTKSIDDEKWMQMITRRKPKSVWSALNKKRIASMIEQGLMTDAGLEKIKKAKKDGSWTTLDEVESLTIPDDLKKAFEANPTAENNFHAFPNSIKKQYLYRIKSAKRPDTRSKRIDDAVKLAEQNVKYLHQQKKK